MEYAIVFLPLAGSILGYFGRNLSNLFCELLTSLLVSLSAFFSILVFILALTPHFMWLIDNDFKTFAYGLKRTSLENSNFLNHIIYPLKFTLKQIGILIPFFGSPKQQLNFFQSS